MLPSSPRDQREDSPSSIRSFSSKSTMSSLQTWFKKRKRNSFSPSPPPRQSSSGSEATSTKSSWTSSKRRDQNSNRFRLFQPVNSARCQYPAHDRVFVNQPQHIQQRNTCLAAAQTRESDQVERIISHCRLARPESWRSSVRFSEISSPQDFTAKELQKPIELSKPRCPIFIGRVFRPHPEPGLRIETKERSRESCLLTTRPLYSARRHSPLITGMPYTAYFESEIRSGKDEDSARLVVGFVAGRDRASFMPGSEYGSLGINFRNGGLYIGRKLLTKVICKPGERVGIGMSFSKREVNTQDADDVELSGRSSPSISIEVFLARDGKKTGSWNLSKSKEAGSLPFEGLEGYHDIYAAVGTLKEVNVDILFDKREWRYHPEAA